MRYGPVLVATVVVCATLTASGAAVSTTPSGQAGIGQSVGALASAAEDNETNASGFGATVSSFVQSESAETEGSVEQGMWKAGVSENASVSAVERRTAALTARLDRLRERRAELRAAYENGSLTRVAYVARLAAIEGQLSAIEAAANDTKPIAAAVGANVSKVEAVGEQARQARGPPGDRGPPDDAGQSGETTPPAEQGPPNGTEEGNETDRGDGDGGAGQGGDSGSDGSS